VELTFHIIRISREPSGNNNWISTKRAHFAESFYELCVIQPFLLVIKSSYFLKQFTLIFLKQLNTTCWKDGDFPPIFWLARVGLSFGTISGWGEKLALSLTFLSRELAPLRAGPSFETSGAEEEGINFFHSLGRIECALWRSCAKRWFSTYLYHYWRKNLVSGHFFKLKM